jgi:hypothetical protein
LRTLPGYLFYQAFLQVQDQSLYGTIFEQQAFKQEQGRISSCAFRIEYDEIKALKRPAKYYFALKPGEIKIALKCGELNEVNYNKKET